ncbi:hypothetical protein [Rhizobium sp. P28RR-XV]|uniref:hypothetical protein n=1 Tax=Rhizobium sp. P28RR-XV TaxID=2726737 RepID=UPI001456419C|nr:hypothetical protein [Rhizobium sp. P28RR-XV]NLR88422.1 hypothetical protein [Rhizobium sp. P28RR-XV]
METKLNHTSRMLIYALEQPIVTLTITCQMLLGAGLAVTLVLKMYMIVFTDQVCVANGATLGNMIRCTPTLILMSQFLITLAGFRLAALMFTERPHLLLEPLLLALTGILLQQLTGMNVAGATWYFSLTVLVLFGAMSGIFAALRYWPECGPTIEQSSLQKRDD